MLPQSSDFLERLEPDNDTFMKKPMSVMITRENLVIGKAVASLGGKDGIPSPK